MAFAILLLFGTGFLLLDSGLNNTSLIASFQKYLPNLGAAASGGNKGITKQ